MKRLAAIAGLLLAAVAHAQMPRTTNVLGIVVKYTNTTQPSNGPASLNSLLFTGSKGMKAFYAEGSAGADRITGHVHPAILTTQQTQPLGKCDLPDMRLLADAIRDAGIDLLQYQRLVVVINASAGGCNGGRAGYLAYDNRTTRISMPLALIWSFTDRFIVHEYMHLEGLGHAKSMNCGANTVALACSFLEYGNAWDIMGNGAYQTPQGASRTKVKWITPLIHTMGKATYTLGPAAAPGGLPSALEVRVPTKAVPGITFSGQRAFWVEYRAPVGFDIRMASFPRLWEGAFINYVSTWYGQVGTRWYRNFCLDMSPCLLDMTPGDGSHYNAALAVGKTFTDPYSGTTIRTDARTDTSLTVTVSIP
jgi:hypothetical protein